jgi:multicomponent Na+:H+ antiporter subunit A
MLLAVLSGFLLAAFAPWIFRALGDKAGWALALLPAGLTVYFASFMPAVMAGEVIAIPYAWVPGLEIDLTFVVDGLSLLFCMLISVIGTFVVLYGSGYLHGDRDLPRFFVLILAFMASMLGLVLSDNLISLFVFWELTSITSFMLIGYYHEKESSRQCAQQSLIVTAGGGLVLLAGLIVLAGMGESYSLRELVSNPEALVAHEHYTLALILILVGCFTKSAQFPFHFWLPNAMAGPTPVSAYLHSATMVKAGVYLLARLNPGLGRTELWMTILPAFGAVTMFIGVYLAVKSTDLKKVLAYSTIMALGTLTMLVGIGTDLAMQAFVAFLLGHSLYKGALFMLAGIVDHEAGTKDITKLSGLRKKMPITAIATGIAALSLAGIPGMFGFVAKELMIETLLGAEFLGVMLITLGVASAALGVVVGALVGLKPFWGEYKETPSPAHDPPLSMILGPVVLAGLSVVFGVLPFIPDQFLVQAAVTSVRGESIDFYLAVWHGFNLPLLMSAVSIAIGAVLFWKWEAVRGAMSKLDVLYAHGPEWLYNRMMDGIVWLASWQTRTIQNGYMRNYIMTILLTMVVLVGYPLVFKYDATPYLEIDARLHEVMIVVLMLAAAVYASVTRSRLGSVAAMGVVGFGVALVYILFSAPDLGITQLLVETLTVILLVLVLFRLPEFVNFSSPAARVRDLFVALSVGGLMTLLMLAAMKVQFHEPISAYHIAESVPGGKGRNIVNVILVDFRAMDTLGEIFVLALAALGVVAMVKFRADRSKPEEDIP